MFDHQNRIINGTQADSLATMTFFEVDLKEDLLSLVAWMLNLRYGGLQCVCFIMKRSHYSMNMEEVRYPMFNGPKF